MLELGEQIPFFWRLSSDNHEGYSQVSMVIPLSSGPEKMEHTIITNVLSFTGDDDIENGEEFMEWNEDDITLFLKLLASKSPPQVRESSHTFKVDLNDPYTIEVIHIVAAAGFGMTMTVDDLLVLDPADPIVGFEEPEVGQLVTLHTIDGYKRGIVVGMDENEGEVVCVLLDSIDMPPPQSHLNSLQAHDLVLVKSSQLLPPEFSSLEPAASDILH
jgi:hypothetical protein